MFGTTYFGQQPLGSSPVVVDTGSTSSPETSYAWTQTSGTPVTLSDPTAARPTFIAPADADGQTLVFSLIVSNTTGTSVADTVTITVSPQLEWVLSSGVWTPTNTVILADINTLL